MIFQELAVILLLLAADRRLLCAQWTSLGRISSLDVDSEACLTWQRVVWYPRNRTR